MIGRAIVCYVEGTPTAYSHFKEVLTCKINPTPQAIARPRRLTPSPRLHLGRRPESLESDNRRRRRSTPTDRLPPAASIPRPRLSTRKPTAFQEARQCKVPRIRQRTR